MSTNRRSFLKQSALISLSPVVPMFLHHSAAAAEVDDRGRILVVIQLDGGNDGINTVVPFGDDAYARHRTTLRLDEKKIHKLDDHVGLHPNMRGAKELFDDGRLAIVQGVGYPNPSRSHFESMAIWHTAITSENNKTNPGWLGKAFDSAPANAVDPDLYFVGNEPTPKALLGNRARTGAVTAINDLRLRLPANFKLSSQPDSPNDLRQFVTRQITDSYSMARKLGERLPAPVPGNNFLVTDLARRLELVSQLIKLSLESRVYYVVQPGYDTHSSQSLTHGTLLSEFSSALKSFLDDLKAAKLDDRVVVMAFSEFGRRVRENGSHGTDHGTAGPVFLAGPKIKPGLHGKAPSLSDLNHGDLKMTVDFRQIYTGLLNDWLGIDHSFLPKNRSKIVLTKS